MVCVSLHQNENVQNVELFFFSLGTNVPLFFKYLEEKYFEKHTNLFPVTGKSCLMACLSSNS